ERVQISLEPAQRKRGHATRSQIEPGLTTRLGPMHVLGMFLCHEDVLLLKRRQYQYTGIPLSMIRSAIMLLIGVEITALATIPKQARAKRMVVTGWPGVLRTFASSPTCLRRNTKIASAVRPNEMKSTVTSK